MIEKLGHYKIVSEPGRGGMGVVYKAYEESLNRYVAIKVLGEHLSHDENFVKRFVREAKAAAGLSHPNVIQIFYIGHEASPAPMPRGRTNATTSSWSSSKAGRCTTCSSRKAPSTRCVPRASCSRPPPVSPSLTIRAWCIATSSRPTCW